MKETEYGLTKGTKYTEKAEEKKYAESEVIRFAKYVRLFPNDFNLEDILLRWKVSGMYLIQA